MSIIQYLRQFATDKKVASIAPTSLRTVKRLLDTVDFSSVDVAVEYGPALGVFTKEILNRLRPNARLIVFETNLGFVQKLREEIQDARFSIHQTSAEHVNQILAKEGLSKANLIVSGIPFSMFGEELKRRIIAATKDALAVGGEFIVYQACFQFFAKENIYTELEKEFEMAPLQREIWNLPPLYACRARRIQDSASAD